MESLEYVCWISPSGYSQAAQDNILALLRHETFDIRVVPLHPSPIWDGISKERQKLFAELSAKPQAAEAVQICHCTPALQKRIVRNDKKRIGFATFETFDPPPAWISSLNSNDAVIVPSQFNQEVFLRAGLKVPIIRIPHCIDTKLFHQGVRPKASILDGKFEKHFKFLFFGSWKKRKGWRGLLEAYWREFSADDRVSLTVKTDFLKDCSRDIEALKKELGLTGKEIAPVLVETTVFDELSLPNFLKAYDCLVFPTMGEGFGLPPIQCMALGVPVIATNFSGCRDYLSNDVATLLEPDGFLVFDMLDDISQFSGRKWAHVPVSSIRQAMRFALSNVDEMKKKAARAAALVSQQFTYERAAKQFREVVNHVRSI